MTSDPSFEIPAWPRRHYPGRGGVEYRGDTMFTLTPNAQHSGRALEVLVESILSSGPYRSGDFLELPMAVWLVRDDRTADVFRVSIRDGTVRLHVLPDTGSGGLRGFYRRLVEHTDCSWTVDCRTDIE